MTTGHGNGVNGEKLLHTFTSRYDSLMKHANTVQVHHHKAFADAAVAVLADERDELDYGLLNDGDKRVAMINAMVRYLTKQADTYMPLDMAKLQNDPLLWLKKEQHLMNYTGGVSAGALSRMINSEKDGQENFTIDKYAGVANEAKESLKGQFLPSTFMHIPDTEAARGAVLGAIGLTGKLDPKKAKLDELVQWMMQFHETGGVVSPKLYQRSAAYVPPGNHAGH